MTRTEFHRYLVELIAPELRRVARGELLAIERLDLAHTLAGKITETIECHPELANPKPPP